MDDLVERIERLARDRARVVIGVTGAPGAGKTTLVTALEAELTARRWPVATVPMDGFHLADVELERLGRRDRKGAIDTFDGYGYVSVLRRIRAEADTTVYAPSFDRSTEEPVAGAIAVEPGMRIVLTEGNYLLDPSEPWARVKDEVTQVWFVEVDADVRRRRLIARHIEFGKEPDHARRWVEQVDERNAVRIGTTKARADLIVTADSWEVQEPAPRSRSANEAR